jgi:hypothetical protein
MRKYFENLHSNTLENLEEIDTLLDIFDLPKLHQEAINHLNRSITSNKIKTVIVSQPRKAKDLMDSLLNSYRPFKEN